MPAFNRVNELVVNKVDSYESFKAMKELGLINPTEVYIVEDDSVVLYSPQELTEEQKAQVLENIGAAAKVYVDEQIGAHEHSWDELKDKPFGEAELLHLEFGGTLQGNTFTQTMYNSYNDSYYYFRPGTSNYLVKFDGEDYYCTGRESISGTGMLNSSLGGVGYPFYMHYDAESDYLDEISLMSVDNEQHHIEVYFVKSQTVCIPEKYIPSTIARTESVDAQFSAVNDQFSNHKHDADYDAKGAASEALDTAKQYTDEQVAGLVDTAPEKLNTLNELAAALGDDPNFAATVLELIGKRVEAVEGMGLSTNDYADADKAKLATVEEGATATSIVIKSWTSADMLCTMSIADLGTYNFEYGMTLGEWVESPYNTDGFFISGNYVWSADDRFAIRVDIDTVLEDGMRYGVDEPT